MVSIQIPVYVGCSVPLLGEIKVKGREASSAYHGKDGLGDVPDPNAPDDSQLQSEHAVQALIRLSQELAGKCAPLLSRCVRVRVILKRAVTRYQNFFAYIYNKKSYNMIMGGVVECDNLDYL